ncbi:MAG: class I SAM-dependent methyltransferase, partial [Flavobacteriales bacterium]
MAAEHQDRWSFLVNFVKHPLRNASVAPSSRIAARNMLRGIDVEALTHVVELGPGTGSFTRELHDRLPKDCKVLVIELDPGYVQRLKEQYGDRFEIVQASAHELDDLVHERGWPKVDLIVSGLPFTLPPEIRKSLWSVL